MPSIFISYRRNDSAQITQRIWENLVGVWGKEKVIKDTDAFLAGPDFREQMSRSIQRADVVLVIIGQHWLDTTNHTGSNRLFDDTDPVRTEIEEALKYKKVIIPVLVNTRQMPETTDLPDSISVIRFRNAFRIHDDARFSDDMKRLNGYFVHPDLIALIGKDALPPDLYIFDESTTFLGRAVTGLRILLCCAVLVIYWLLVGYTTPMLFPPKILRISGSNYMVMMLHGDDAGLERFKVLIVVTGLTIDWLVVGSIVSLLFHGSLFAISSFDAAFLFGTLQFVVAVVVLLVALFLERRAYVYRNEINLRKTLLVVSANCLLTFASSFQFLGISYLYVPLFITVLTVSLFVYTLVGIGLASYSDNLSGINRTLALRQLQQERARLARTEFFEQRRALRETGGHPHSKAATISAASVLKSVLWWILLIAVIALAIGILLLLRSI